MPLCLATAKSLGRHPGLNVRRVHYAGPPHDVFINHRGIDTKLNLSGLLFHRFSELNLRPFLDIKSMRPGEPLLEKLNEAIRGCKVGVAVFSPRYCESPHCLHELAMLRETKKRVIPIFCDVKPSQLQVVDDGNYSDMDLQRFSAALEEARDAVGLTFDTVRGYCVFAGSVVDVGVRTEYVGSGLEAAVTTDYLLITRREIYAANFFLQLALSSIADFDNSDIWMTRFVLA
ncbi:hypothetical protein NL676_012893 [Syzygium grande]|nr:hypothetical protein NL676_012893 [Syzygium grande]